MYPNTDMAVVVIIWFQNLASKLFSGLDIWQFCFGIAKEKHLTFEIFFAKFVDKGVKASATRARKALAELSKLIKARRKEIQEVKNAAKTAA